MKRQVSQNESFLSVYQDMETSHRGNHPSFTFPQRRRRFSGSPSRPRYRHMAAKPPNTNLINVNKFFIIYVYISRLEERNLSLVEPFPFLSSLLVFLLTLVTRAKHFHHSSTRFGPTCRARDWKRTIRPSKSKPPQ